MNKTTKIALYSLGAIAVFTAFFYFYPAAIFEMDIVEGKTRYSLDVSLKAILDKSALPDVVSQENLRSATLTIKGILLLIICLAGIPIMIGYRLATNNEKVQKTEK